MQHKEKLDGLLFRNVLLFEPITGSSQKEDLIYLDLV